MAWPPHAPGRTGARATAPGRSADLVLAARRRSLLERAARDCEALRGFVPPGPGLRVGRRAATSVAGCNNAKGGDPMSSAQVRGPEVVARASATLREDA